MTAAQRQSQTSADAFEPPPPSMTAAQRQAQAAGATTPSADPIQAAADAYEPPPANLRAAQQQARAAQSTDPDDPPARVMRASTGSLAAPKDDPIARFAN